MIDPKKDYVIYVQSYTEFIEIQKFLFSNNVFWCGIEPKELFVKWTSGVELIFPRYLYIVYIDNNDGYYMANGVANNNSIEADLLDQNKLICINAITLLRKKKLLKIANIK